MNNKKHKWILLATTAVAKFYTYDAHEKTLNLIEQLNDEKASMKDSEILTDRAGRYQKSSTMTGGYQLHTQPHQAQAQRFAVKIAEFLHGHQEQIDKIYILAPGHFQAHIKSTITDLISKKVEIFIDKDYTHLAIQDIKKHLTETVNLRF